MTTSGTDKAVEQSQHDVHAEAARGGDKELLLTKDGSHTVIIPSLDVTYRSRHGAIQESMHVFIDAGLKYKWSTDPQFATDTTRPIRIFELGFGTGLSALLTAKEATAAQRSISYTTIEPEPLEPAMARRLNYEDGPGDLQKMHEAEWGTRVRINPYFLFTKYKLTLADFNPDTARLNSDEHGSGYDLIYFDAFGPLTAPGLWSAESFTKIVSLMKQGAVLTTYCSKSVVRKTMMSSGLNVKKIQGPYGKREMVRATK
ncbi:tRNA (5-methylaminomethyl-2-thiouridine)(34)-methyltransferase MnmD [Flavitalea antarctica]